jgi:very-short-patch-repair endonuclease
MRKERANRERVIADLAANQHGVVAVRQLAAAGLPDYSVTRRVKAGRLHRLHRGVYAVGHTSLSFEGRCMAAALAVGGEAVVSHRSAAAVWGILRPHAGRIDVSVPGSGGRRKRHGITIHRSHSLIAGVTTRRNGIAVTKAARTLRDLHRTSPEPVFKAAVRRALDLRLITEEELDQEPDLTRSELERLFLHLCRRYRLPQPEVNVRLGRYEVDFLWRAERVTIETDGFRHHRNRAAFEADRSRDAHLQGLGYRVLRFTYRQVRDEPRQVVEALRALLTQSFPLSHPLPP